MKRFISPFFLLSILVLTASCGRGAQTNLALHRMALASSSYDNNLTAHLVTDGIVPEGTPVYMVVNSSEGLVGKDERECTIDGDPHSRNIITGDHGWMEYAAKGYELDADMAQVLYCLALPGGRSGQDYTVRVPVVRCDSSSALHFDLTFPSSGRWRVKEVEFYKDGCRISDVLPSEHFYSAWMSAGCDDEWLMVDLGAESMLSDARIFWINRAAQVDVEVSRDGKKWKTVSRGSMSGLTEEVKCNSRARYVRVNMHGGTQDGKPYCIGEICVNGAAPAEQTRSDWKVQRASEVEADGLMLSSEDYDDSAWLPATVPATVLQNYINAGAVPDPDYGDNWAQISESYFLNDFWYRYTFDAARPCDGRHCFADFDGINWKADIYLNSNYVGRIDGAFIRGHFDVTDYVRDGRNVMAVRIHRNDHPGAVTVKNARWTGYNGGILGADNPTFVASIGWDWMTTVRGRNCGIWNDVRFAEQGAAGVSDPLVRSVVDENGLASMTVSVTVSRNDASDVPLQVEGWIGDIHFSKTVCDVGEVVFTPQEYPQLLNQCIDLWWPNNYGAPALHDAGFTVSVDGVMSDSLHFKAGIRQIESKIDGGALKLYVNGRRFNPMGGNWGFSQHNLKYSARDYDTAVDYHRQMNFNMIRNWVGQIADEEFYEACDRYGIVVWQDFWLANPLDGPDPADEAMFLDNAFDLVRKIRRHPSVCLYCGRNEGYPPQSLDRALKNDVTAVLHPDVPYISSSADGPVSGRGPYNAEPVEYYFTHQSGKLHSERGMPNPLVYESLEKFIPEDQMWPVGEMFGKHDFTQDGPQMGHTYMKLMDKTFGQCTSIKEFCSLAQWIDYDGYRAMFESANSGGRMGLLLWMSHSCWPSLCWNVYDYYFQPHGAFFGCKKACEPLHIQYNPVSRKVELVNQCAGDCREFVAQASMYDATGKPLWDYVGFVNMDNDSTTEYIDIPAVSEGDGIRLLDLRLYTPSWTPVSDNLYFISADGDLSALKELPQAELKQSVYQQDNIVEVVLENTSDTPAMMLRLMATDGNGDEILPVEYSDNYFTILPHRSKSIFIYWPADRFSGTPGIEIRHPFQYSK